jgi:endoglucanase
MKKTFAALFLLISSFQSYSQNFVQRQGNKLYHHNQEVLLRGMAFGNLVWEDDKAPNQHHKEVDLQRIARLGMNAIRFYMNYNTFESDTTPFQYKQSGWDWIDSNIVWARKNNIYLILNMHVPQGGFQSQCGGDALWTNPDNQTRVSALWKAIAERYKNEPQIAGYDLINEPTPSGSIDNWTNLAQRIIDSIRTVDQNHLIITERAIALGCDYGYANEYNNYPQITEENLMYTVHLYDPYEFTHQLLDWADTGDGGKYPDPNQISQPSDAQYATGNYSNPSISSGTNDWKYFEGKPFKVATDTLALGKVVFISNGINTGKVYFDDIEVKELDAQGNLIRILYKDKISHGGNMWYWSENNTGSLTQVKSGHGDNFSIMVSGNTGNATVACNDFSFLVKKGNQYVVSGWMKGENIPIGASANITTEYLYSPSGEKAIGRDYEFLKNRIIQSAQYVVDIGYPVYFGEFGAGRPCFENDKGGERWVADAMTIFDSLGYHFTYHSYKENSFGYYDGWVGPVDTTTVNLKLKKVFEEFFGVSSPSGFNNFKSDKGVKIYPNPVKDIIHVELDKAIHFDAVQILDLQGNKLQESQSSALNISDLKPGAYILRISTKKHTKHAKFIKE